MGNHEHPCGVCGEDKRNWLGHEESDHTKAEIESRRDKAKAQGYISKFDDMNRLLESGKHR